MEKKNEGNVRSIQRAFDILLCFKWDTQELGLTEIAEKIGLAKSTTHRLLATLENQGFLRKNRGTNKYVLGYNVYYLGLIAKENLNVNKISYPIMEEIRNKSQETVLLYLRENEERSCAQQIESTSTIKQTVRIGERFPLWEGASGKCILAHLDEEIWQRMAREIVPLTENTITDSEEFIAELEKIRESGYATSYGERNTEVSCVAAPVFDGRGQIVGSLTISGPTFRVPKNPIPFINYVVEGAEKISIELGYKPTGINDGKVRKQKSF